MAYLQGMGMPQVGAEGSGAWQRPAVVLFFFLLFLFLLPVADVIAAAGVVAVLAPLARW